MPTPIHDKNSDHDDNDNDNDNDGDANESCISHPNTYHDKN